ncbi:MAG: hypothetical protein E6346_04245 [Lactococcus lactis]|nr:hypothetical protein [Lactococcus lactis]
MEKLKNLWDNKLWFKILVIVVILALSYWFGIIAILLGMILFIYAIVTVIRKYIFKKNTRFKARYILLSFLALTIMGGYGYAQTHPEEMEQSRIRQQAAKAKKAEDAKNAAEAKKAAEESNFYSAMTSAAQTVNNNLGSTAIDSIDKGSIYPVLDVQLNIIFASYTNMEIKSLVQTLNESLVQISINNGQTHPQIKYYISGVSIGENRSILNPSEVKFNSNIK